MGLFNERFTKEGPGVEKGQDKKGIALFFEIFIREFWQLVKLNLIFLLACIPIVTIPSAISGMTYVTMKMVRDETSYAWADFLVGFKQNWKSACVIGIINFIICLLIGSSLYIGATQQIYLFYTIAIFLGFLSGIILLHAFPMIVTVDLPLKQALKNSVILGISRLPYSLLMLVLAVVVILLSILFLPLTFPLIILISFSTVSFIVSFGSWAGIKKYVIKEEAE